MKRRMVQWVGYGYFAAVAVLLLFGAGMRLSPVATPFLEPDSTGYILPALDLLEQGEFRHRNARPYGYGLFVAAALAAGDFGTLTVIQRCLGLSGCILLMLAWERYREPGARLVPALVHRGLGLAVVSVTALSPSLIYYEYTALTEAFAVFYLSALVFFLGRFIAYNAALDARGRGSPRFYAECLWMMLLACAGYVIKPSLGFLVPAVLSLVGVVAVVRPGTADEPGLRFETRPLLPVLLGAVLAAGIILLPERHLAAKDPASKMYASQMLFAFNAAAIEPLLREDLEHSQTININREELKELLRRVSGGRAHPAGGFPLTGYNPEILIYDDRYDSSFLSEKYPPERVADVYRDYVRRALWAEPGRYARRVVNELRFFFAEDRLVDNEKVRRHTYDTFVCDQMCAERGCASGTRLAKFCERSAELAATDFVHPVPAAPPFTAGMRTLLDAAYFGRWLLFFSGVALIGAAWLRRYGPIFLRDAVLVVLVRDVLVLAVCAGAVIVAVAMTHSYSVTRFIEYQQTLHAFLSALMSYTIFMILYESGLRYARYVRDQL